MTFPELWDSITGNAAKPRIDPLVEVGSVCLTAQRPSSQLRQTRVQTC